MEIYELFFIIIAEKLSAYFVWTLYIILDYSVMLLVVFCCDRVCGR